jgi:hypothetical protein
MNILWKSDYEINVLMSNDILDYKYVNLVATLVLGSQPKQRFVKMWAKSEAGSCISCFWECKRIWKNEAPHSQMNFHFRNFKFSKGDYKGQISLD